MSDDEGEEAGGGGGSTTRDNVMPSLVALQQTRNRLHMANLGRKLMIWTEMAAGRELRLISANIDRVYQSYKEDMSNAFILLARCRYFTPSINAITLENISPRAYVSVESSGKFVSGVKCIQFQVKENPAHVPYPFLGLGQGGEMVAKCKEAWLNLLKLTIMMVQLRKSFISIENAYKSAAKRHNVLSRIIIPRLHHTCKYIILELEDLSREEIHRIKMVKKVKKATSKVKTPEPKAPEPCATCESKKKAVSLTRAPKEPKKISKPDSQNYELCETCKAKGVKVIAHSDSNVYELCESCKAKGVTAITKSLTKRDIPKLSPQTSEPCPTCKSKDIPKPSPQTPEPCPTCKSKDIPKPSPQTSMPCPTCQSKDIPKPSPETPMPYLTCKSKDIPKPSPQSSMPCPTCQSKDIPKPSPETSMLCPTCQSKDIPKPSPETSMLCPTCKSKDIPKPSPQSSMPCPTCQSKDIPKPSPETSMPYLTCKSKDIPKPSPQSSMPCPTCQSKDIPKPSPETSMLCPTCKSKDIPKPSPQSSMPCPTCQSKDIPKPSPEISMLCPTCKSKDIPKPSPQSSMPCPTCKSKDIPKPSPQTSEPCPTCKSKDIPKLSSKTSMPCPTCKSKDIPKPSPQTSEPCPTCKSKDIPKLSPQTSEPCPTCKSKDIPKLSSKTSMPCPTCKSKDIPKPSPQTSMPCPTCKSKDIPKLSSKTSMPCPTCKSKDIPKPSPQTSEPCPTCKSRDIPKLSSKTSMPCPTCKSKDIPKPSPQTSMPCPTCKSKDIPKLSPQTSEPCPTCKSKDIPKLSPQTSMPCPTCKSKDIPKLLPQTSEPCPTCKSKNMPKPVPKTSETLKSKNIPKLEPKISQPCSTCKLKDVSSVITLVTPSKDEADPCMLCSLMLNLQAFLNCIATAESVKNHDENMADADVDDGRSEILKTTMETLKTELKTAIEESSDKGFVDACLGVACKVDENMQILLGTPSEVKLLQEQLTDFIQKAKSIPDHSCGTSSIESLIKKTLHSELPDKQFSIVVLSVHPSNEDITETCHCKESGKKKDKGSRRKGEKKSIRSKSDPTLNKCPYCNTLVKSETTIRETSVSGQCECGASSRVPSQKKTGSHISGRSTCSCTETSANIATKESSSMTKNNTKRSRKTNSKGSIKSNPKSSAVTKETKISDTDDEKCPICYQDETNEDEKCPVCSEADGYDKMCSRCRMQASLKKSCNCPKSKSESNASTRNPSENLKQSKKDPTQFYLSLVNQTFPSLSNKNIDLSEKSVSTTVSCPECNSEFINDMLLNYVCCKHDIKKGMENNFNSKKVCNNEYKEYKEALACSQDSENNSNCPFCIHLQSPQKADSQQSDINQICYKCIEEMKLFRHKGQESVITLGNPIVKTKLCGCAQSQKCNTLQILFDEKDKGLTLADLKIIKEVIPASRCGCVQMENKENQIICTLKKPIKINVQQKSSLKTLQDPIQSTKSIKNHLCDNSNEKEKNVCDSCKYKQNKCGCHVQSKTPICEKAEQLKNTSQEAGLMTKQLKYPICFSGISFNSLKSIKSLNDNTEKCYKSETNKKTRKTKSLDSMSQKDTDQSAFACLSCTSSKQIIPIAKKSSVKEVGICTTNTDKPGPESISDTSVGSVADKKITSYKSTSGKLNEAIKNKTLVKQDSDPDAKYFEISDDISDFSDDIYDF